MAVVNFYLKEPKSKTETPINVLFHYEGNRFKLSSGEKILPRFWNPEAQRAKKSLPGSPEFNSKLDGIEGELKRIYRVSQSSKAVLSRESLRREMLKYIKPNTALKKSFFDFFTEFMEIKKATQKPNTIKKFQSLFNHLKQFEQLTRNKVSFENMDARFHEQFTAFLITKRLLLNNSVGKYVATLKSFLHWATERGYNTHAGFLKFKTMKEESDIIYLTEKELMKLYSFNFKRNERLRQVRDVFCFGCFTGLRYSDIARLRPENVKDEEIHFKTAKTRDSLIVPLNSFALKLLQKYNYRLPVISNQKTNEYLKEMGRVAEIDTVIILTKYSGAKEIQLKEPKYKFITSHVARRTFVTLSLEKGMRPEIVMSITGHKRYEIFKRYIKITSKVKLVEMKQIWNKQPNLSVVI